MPFDLHHPFPDDEGDFGGASLSAAWLEALDATFLDSPEGQTLVAAGGPWSWGRMVLEAAYDYEGVPPNQVDADVLTGIVFGWIPRKVSVDPEAAGEILQELRLFFQWLGRAHGHPHAAACVAAMGEASEAALSRELANPATFGMAKSLFMGGDLTGFDMPREEDLLAQALAQRAAPALSPDEKRARRKAHNARRKQRRKKKR